MGAARRGGVKRIGDRHDLAEHALLGAAVTQVSGEVRLL
jgi:hypothetical protein